MEQHEISLDELFRGFSAQGLDLHQAKIGEELGPIEYLLTEEVIRYYADMVDDRNPWFIQDSPFGGCIAHPTIGANDYALVVATKYSMIGAIHAKAAHEFVNPIRLGKRIKVKGKIVDVYKKKGRDYLIIETVTVDEDGVELVRSRNTWLLATEGKDAR